MSEPDGTPPNEDLNAKAEEAGQRLRKVADSAEAAQERVAAEITALEAELEKERRRGGEAVEELRDSQKRELEELRARQAEELRQVREEKERAIAGAESRLAEIEAQVEAAEERVKVAELRAADAEKQIADAEARVRSAAAEWLRGQIDALRREARQ